MVNRKRGNMIDFDAVRPTGQRSYSALKPGSSPANNVWMDDEVEKFKAELDAMHRGKLDTTLTRPQHLDAIGALRVLRRTAARGQLKVGDDNTYPARRIKRVNYLLELRPALGRGTPPPRLFRLYYAEPNMVPDGLLPLALATKPRGKDIDDEQDDAIDEAEGRSKTWALYRAMEESKK
jgi:hypothetical protein